MYEFLFCFFKHLSQSVMSEFELPTEGSMWFGFRKGGVSVILSSANDLFPLGLYFHELFFKATLCIDLCYHQRDLTFKIINISFILLRQKNKNKKECSSCFTMNSMVDFKIMAYGLLNLLSLGLHRKNLDQQFPDVSPGPYCTLVACGSHLSNHLVNYRFSNCLGEPEKHHLKLLG